MVELYQSLSPEVWTATFTGISTFVIVIGVIIALVNLRIIANTQHLEAIGEFLKDWADASDDRKFILQDFNFSPENELPHETEKKAQNVINCLNRVGLLLDNRLLSSHLVFSICHTQIIRCWYKLEAYVKYHESRIGGRYGRRLEHLFIRAKKYHDISSQHRITKIKIDPGFNKDSFVIYETTIDKGWSGSIQKINWWLRKLFNIF